MGSLCRVQVLYADIAAFLQKWPALPVYGAFLDGMSITQTAPIQQGILVIGNESKGISEQLRPLIQHRVTIPGTGNAESLNAAVATGIILSHLKG